MWRDIVVITDLAASCRCGDPSVNMKCLKLHASLDVLWLGFWAGFSQVFSGGLKSLRPWHVDYSQGRILSWPFVSTFAHVKLSSSNRQVAGEYQ